MSEVNSERFETQGITAPLAALAENLAAHARRRTQASLPFRTGDWLATLSTAQIAGLSEALGAVLDGLDSADLVGILGVVVVLMALESTPEPVKADPESMHMAFAALNAACSMERLRRNGLIELRAPLSIDPASQVAYRLTPLGAAAAPASPILH